MKCTDILKIALFFCLAFIPVFTNGQELTEQQITEGMQNGQFIAYFQPVYSLYGGNIKEAEVLSRWQKDGKIINPGNYIPFIERSSLTKDFDLYMFALACGVIKKMRESGAVPVALAVNFSRKTLSLQGIVKEINVIADSYGINRNLIGIEVTETFDLPSRRNLVKNVRELKESGFAVYIDDFGTGFNKLSDIYKLRPDILKLDKSLLPKNSLFENESKKQIAGITKKAHDLGIKVICEGVENSEQITFLKECGVDEGQGFFFSKPLPLENFINRLRN